jgi:hypothetical protein
MIFGSQGFNQGRGLPKSKSLTTIDPEKIRSQIIVVE